MKNKNHLNLLIVSEQEADFAEIKKLFIQAEIDFRDHYCKTLKRFTTQIHELDPHLIILYKLHEGLTPEMVSNYLKTFHISIPLLLLVPEHLEDIAIDYMGEIIDDYVIISHQKRIPVAVNLLVQKKKDYKSQQQSLRFMLESEKRWQAIFNSEPECILITSPEGLVSEVNASGLLILETENPRKIIHHPITKFIHPDDLKIYKKFHQSVSRGNSGQEQFRLIGTKGKVTWLNATGTPLRDAEQNILSVLIIGMDITIFIDLKSDFKLKESWFNNILSQMPAGVFQANTTGDLVYVNQKWCKLTGLQPEEALGTGWLSAIHTEEREVVINSWNQLVKNQIPFHQEFRYVNSTGDVFWISVSAVEMKDDTGVISGFIGTASDINDNRHFEEAFIDSQNRLESVQELVKIGDWTWDLNTKKTSWSAEMFPLHGRNPSFGPPPFDEFISLVHPDDRQKVLSFQKRVIENGHSIGDDYRIILPDGNFREVYPTGYCMYDTEGNPTKIIGSLVEVTERIKSHESIRRNEQFIDTLFSQSIDGMFEMKSEKPFLWEEHTHKDAMIEYAFHNFRISRVNDAFLDIHGISRDKIIGKTAYEIDAIKGNVSDKELWREFFDKGRMRNNILTCKFDKSPLWLQGDYICLYDKEGRISGQIGFQKDITKEKTAIEELKFSERNFREIFENSPDGIYIEDYNGVILNVNTEASKIQGMNKAELIGKNILDLTPEDKKESVFNNFRKLCAGEINRLDSFSWDKEWNPIPMEIKVSRISYSGVPAILLHVRDMRIKKVKTDFQVMSSSDKNIPVK